MGLLEGGLLDAVLEFEEVDFGYGGRDAGFGVIGEGLGGFGKVLKVSKHGASVFLLVGSGRRFRGRGLGIVTTWR